MSFSGLTNALKGIGGEFEVTRIIGAGGAAAYVVGAHAFLIWNQLEGRAFDLAVYCLSFPAGLGVAVGATAGAAAIKDRQVATSRIIQETGAVPAKPPAQVPITEQPAKVTVDDPDGG